MFKRTLITAIAGLGATMSFATMNTAGAMALARPTMVAPPSNALRITEMLVNPQGTDNGNERIEITNTGNVDIDLATCYFLYIDGETSQNGEVDAMVALGTGSGGANTLGTGSRTLAAGATIVFCDKVGNGARSPIAPEGGTVVEIDFENTAGLGELHNSLGLMALITSPVTGFDAGDNVDANGNGVLDGTYWGDTLHCVDMKRATDESGGEAYFSDAGLPDAGGDGYNRVKVRQMADWTPDGFSLLKDNATSLWDNALIYDTETKTSPGNVFDFDRFTSPFEYTFGVDTGDNTPVTVSGTPRVTPGLIGQYQVTNGTTASVVYTH